MRKLMVLIIIACQACLGDRLLDWTPYSCYRDQTFPNGGSAQLSCRMSAGVCQSNGIRLGAVETWAIGTNCQYQFSLTASATATWSFGYYGSNASFSGIFGSGGTWVERYCPDNSFDTSGPFSIPTC